jgi:hypothetical protein
LADSSVSAQLQTCPVRNHGLLEEVLYVISLPDDIKSSRIDASYQISLTVENLIS